MKVTSVISCAMTFTIWIVSCNSKVSSHHGSISYSNNFLKDTQRQERSGNVLGMASFKVIQSLLRDATELTPTGTTRQFVKRGNFMKASKDFINTRATDRYILEHTGLSGKIGDGKIIMLRTSKKDGLPVILVKSTGDDTKKEEITHRIKYKGFTNDVIDLF